MCAIAHTRIHTHTEQLMRLLDRKFIEFIHFISYFNTFSWCTVNCRDEPITRIADYWSQLLGGRLTLSHPEAHPWWVKSSGIRQSKITKGPVWERKGNQNNRSIDQLMLIIGTVCCRLPITDYSKLRLPIVLNWQINRLYRFGSIFWHISSKLAKFYNTINCNFSLANFSEMKDDFCFIILV